MVSGDRVVWREISIHRRLCRATVRKAPCDDVGCEERARGSRRTAVPSAQVRLLTSLHLQKG